MHPKKESWLSRRLRGPDRYELYGSARREREDVGAKRTIVAVLSAICYLLLWKCGYLGWSPGIILLVVAIPLFFRLFSIAFNPGETAVAGILFVTLFAVLLITWKNVLEKRQKTEELRAQRAEH